jgi:hypothetical protein
VDQDSKAVARSFAQGQGSAICSRVRLAGLVIRAAACGSRKRGFLGSASSSPRSSSNLHPGGQVHAGQRELEPGQVDRVLAGWEAAESGPPAAAGAVVDAGASPVTGLDTSQQPVVGTVSAAMT